MSSKALIVFSSEKNNVSIQCPKNHKLKDVCQLYAKKMGHDINYYSFEYSGCKVDLELSFDDLALPIDKTDNKMVISVIKIENEGNYCPYCDKNILLKTKDVDEMTLSNNKIKNYINEIKNNIEKLIKICSINSINIQLQNVNIILTSINAQIENYNNNLQKSLKNITKFTPMNVDENKVNLKNDEFQRENDNKKELYEKQQREKEKESETKKKLKEDEEKRKMEQMKKRLKEEEEKRKMEQMKKQLQEEEKKKKIEQLKQEEAAKKNEPQKITPKAKIEINKLKKEQFNEMPKEFTMSSRDFGYACTCTNALILQQFIYAGTDIAEIPLLLKNNGLYRWPPNTKLVFEKKFKIFGKDVILDSLEPKQEKKFIVKIEGLKDLPLGEYEAGAYFNIKDRNHGNMIKMKITVIKREVEPKIKYKKEIDRFRDEYGLKEEEYSDDDLYDILLSNDFNLEKAFMCLIGDI